MGHHWTPYTHCSRHSDLLALPRTCQVPSGFQDFITVPSVRDAASVYLNDLCLDPFKPWQECHLPRKAQQTPYLTLPPSIMLCPLSLLFFFYPPPGIFTYVCFYSLPQLECELSVSRTSVCRCWVSGVNNRACDYNWHAYLLNKWRIQSMNGRDLLGRSGWKKLAFLLFCILTQCMTKIDFFLLA